MNELPLYLFMLLAAALATGFVAVLVGAFLALRQLVLLIVDAASGPIDGEVDGHD